MKYPHVRLPKKTDRILHILCEDLKNNYTFNNLAKVGFDDSNSRSEFTFFILDIVFKETSDDLSNLYFSLLQKHTKKLNDTGQSSLAKRAIKFYVDLMIERKRRTAMNSSQ
jgi:hypothetical protein